MSAKQSGESLTAVRFCFEVLMATSFCVWRQLTAEQRYEQDQAIQVSGRCLSMVVHKTRFSQEELRDALLLQQKKSR